MMLACLPVCRLGEDKPHRKRPGWPPGQGCCIDQTACEGSNLSKHKGLLRPFPADHLDAGQTEKRQMLSCRPMLTRTVLTSGD